MVDVSSRNVALPCVFFGAAHAMVGDRTRDRMQAIHPRNEGPDGLLDRSHRPHTCPHATEPASSRRRSSSEGPASVGIYVGFRRVFIRLFHQFGLPERTV